MRRYARCESLCRLPIYLRARQEAGGEWKAATSAGRRAARYTRASRDELQRYSQTAQQAAPRYGFAALRRQMKAVASWRRM